MKSTFIAAFFQTAPPPAGAMGGHYNFYLVALSLLIATLASFVALSIANYMRQGTPKTLVWPLLGGAIAMGAGIFTMHFVGMLAFIMPMTMGYDLIPTFLSIVIAIAASGLALFLVRKKSISLHRLLLGGTVIGIAIAGMHYTGMEAMIGVSITYRPFYFFLSIAIAIAAAIAALWLMIQCDKQKRGRRKIFKLGSALLMGGAICGMHYVGITAAVFVPLPHAALPPELFILSPVKIAVLISYIAVLIMIIGLYITGRQYSIFFKLILGYLIIVFMLLPIAYTSIENIKSMTTVFTAITNQAIPKIVALLEMKSLSAKIEEISNSINEATPVGVWADKKKAIAAYLNKLENFEKKYNDISTNLSGKDVEHLRELKNSLNSSEAALIDATQKKLSQTDIINIKNNLEKSSKALDRFIEKQTETESRKLAQLEEKALTLKDRLIVITLIIVGTILPLALFLSLFTSFKISKPIIELEETAQKIAKGRLAGQRVKVQSEDEIGQLSMSFNTMVAALEASNKKRDEFVGMAAHDLRVPTSVISEGSNLLVTGAFGELNTKQHRLAEMICKASRSMVSLLDELLAVNAGGAVTIQINRKKVNLVDFLENIFSFNQLLAEKKHIVLEMNNETGKETAYFDEGKIAQVINNFMSNALKFSQYHSKVSTVVKKNGENLRVEVHDHASGIPEEEQKWVFTWFAKISVKPTGGEASHGLGLAICKDIIHAHGGEIGFVSQWGKGSTFFFEIAAFDV